MGVRSRVGSRGEDRLGLGVGRVEGRAFAATMAWVCFYDALHGLLIHRHKGPNLSMGALK